MLIPSWIVHKSHLESWSFLEGVYFAVTTLTTVGLGDFYPARSTIYYQLASSGWLWIGLALVSTLLQVASDYQKLFGEKVAKCLCVCCRKRRYEAIQTAPAFYKRLN